MTGSTDLPEPFVPAGTSIAGLPCFMLDVDRLFASELWALSSGEEFKAAVALWGRAWQQVPAGSLPADERLLAAFSGAGKRWPKVRGIAMRGFVKCSDGRFYHRVLCEDVIRAAKAKREKHERTIRATEARKKKDDDGQHPPSGGKNTNDHNKTGDRHVDRDVDRDDPRDVDRNVPRHDARHDPHMPDVTTNVTFTHRRDETRRKKEREEPARPSHPEPRAVNAGPGLAEAWNSRANFDRVEARCRRDLAGGGPQDLRIGPMAAMEHDGYSLESEIIPNLLDVAASARQPIRTWTIYAERCRERIDAQRMARAAQGVAATPRPAGPMVDLGSPYGEWAEAGLAMWISRHRDDPGVWREDMLGPAPGRPGCRIPGRMLLEAA